MQLEAVKRGDGPGPNLRLIEEGGATGGPEGEELEMSAAEPVGREQFVERTGRRRL